MQLLTRIELIEELNSTKKIMVNLTGSINTNLCFKNFTVQANNNIIAIRDDNSSVEINFNVIRSMQEDKDNILIYLDDDTIIEIFRD